jgi:hypothetical protein
MTDNLAEKAQQKSTLMSAYMTGKLSEQNVQHIVNRVYFQRSRIQRTFASNFYILLLAVLQTIPCSKGCLQCAKKAFPNLFFHLKLLVNATRKFGKDLDIQ